MELKAGLFIEGQEKKKEIIEFIKALRQHNILSKKRAKEAGHYIERAFQVAFVQDTKERYLLDDDLIIINNILNQVARGKRKVMFELTEDGFCLREVFTGEEWQLMVGAKPS